jgi:hypothetical protein
MMTEMSRLHRQQSRAWLAAPARATDEIQVYNAGIAAPGQFTIQQHMNYVGLGIKQPPFPGRSAG